MPPPTDIPESEDLGVEALRRFGGRLLDRLAVAVLADPTPDTARGVLEKARDPWARLFARTRLASIAEGMADAWDDLPLELTEEEERDVAVIASHFAGESDTEKRRILETFTPQERLVAESFLGLPPEEPAADLELAEHEDLDGIRLPTYEWALEALAEKRLVTREEWDQLEAEELGNAFTVAGLETDAALARVRDALATTLREGFTLEEFKEAAGPANFLSDAHAETVFRTNLHQGYSDGKLALVEHPAVADAFPYATFDPIHDDRVRKTHRALASQGLDGTNVYRVDDPVWQAIRPPFDFNCRCAWGPLTIRQAARKGVKEAETWLEEERPPASPQHVPWPTYNGQPIQPNPRFRRG